MALAATEQSVASDAEQAAGKLISLYWGGAMGALILPAVCYAVIPGYGWFLRRPA